MLYYLFIVGSSFAGCKPHKWLSDEDSPDKALENLDRKSYIKEGKRCKRRLPSPIPFATSGKVAYLRFI